MKILKSILIILACVFTILGIVGITSGPVETEGHSQAYILGSYVGKYFFITVAIILFFLIRRINRKIEKKSTIDLINSLPDDKVTR